MAFWLFSLLVDFQTREFFPLTFLISANQTSLELSMILHYLATEIAVRTLSPVIITVLILDSYKFEITPAVCTFNLFSMTKRPKKVSPHSISPRGTPSAFLYVMSGRAFVASPITLNPSLV